VNFWVIFAVWLVGAVLTVAVGRRLVDDDDDQGIEDDSVFLEGLAGVAWPIIVPLAMVVGAIAGIGWLGRKLGGK